MKRGVLKVLFHVANPLCARYGKLLLTKTLSLNDLYNDMEKKTKTKTHRRCTVGPCDNDERYPDAIDIMSHVHPNSFTWHKFPTDKSKCDDWVRAISKGWKITLSATKGKRNFFFVYYCARCWSEKS